MIFCFLILGLTASALAQTKAQLGREIESLSKQLAEMQESPYPQPYAQDTSKVDFLGDELHKAQGIILLDRTKGVFIFGYHRGNGVALAKDADGHWSAPAFVSSTGASLGFQIGGEKDFFVILLMSSNAVHALGKQTVDFGAQVNGTSLGHNYSAQAGTVSPPTVLVYSMHRGLFGGAYIKGGAISPDNHDNAVYYEKHVSMNGILFHHEAQPTRVERLLVKSVTQYGK
jgi:lipid-binding SYLF domain-containing protein